MPRFPKLSTIVRSAVLAIALGGATIGATAPVMAAPPHIDLHFGFGGGGISIGGGRYCMSDRQVRFLLRDQGYSNVYFLDRHGRVVVLHAERHHRDYRITVDTCRGRIISIDRTHH
jgi:hypothetical protein